MYIDILFQKAALGLKNNNNSVFKTFMFLKLSDVCIYLHCEKADVTLCSVLLVYSFHLLSDWHLCGAILFAATAPGLNSYWDSYLVSPNLNYLPLR